MTLAIMITVLSFMMVINSVTKFYCDWASLREYCEEGDVDHFGAMKDDKWRWIMRHFICAVLGMGFITYIKCTPSFDHYDLLAKLAAVHVVLSLLCIFIESLFIMRISSEITVRMKTVKVKSDDIDMN